jgi:hypothetical protein
MLTRMLCCLFLIFSSSLMARDEYVVGMVGYGKHSQDTMKDSSTYPVGTSYGGGLGYRNNFYEFELLATKSNYQVDIVHDGVANTLIHDQALFNLSMNFYLLRHLYVRLGYGLGVIEQKTKLTVGGASGAGLTESYGLVKEKIGVANLGLGYVFLLGARMNLYTQYEHFMMGDIAGSQSQVSVGFRWYLK